MQSIQGAVRIWNFLILDSYPLAKREAPAEMFSESVSLTHLIHPADRMLIQSKRLALYSKR